MMDLQNMKVFLKIAEYENLSRASDELHIAQPHLTRQLKAMEKDMGVSLFTREKKRLHITREGVYLVHQCREMLSLEEETRNRLLEMSQGTAGRIYLGAIETAGTVFLPDWIEGFQKRYPLVRYYIWTANSEDVVERLRHHLIDLALIRTKFDKEQYEGMPIGQERWIALISRDHPLARKKEKLSLEELSQEFLIIPTTRSREIRDWFGDAGLSANIFCEFSPLMNALVMAERNLGIAILPESAIVHFKMHPVVIRQLQKEVVTEVSLIWRKDNTLSGAEQKFVEYVREVKANDENKIFETNN